MQLHLERPWKELMPKLIEHNADLTVADLQYEEGKDDQLLEAWQGK